MITWSWLAERASAVSWFPAETRWNEFWTQSFHQLWNKIGMQKWMWNCGIEGGLFNPNSFSTTRGKKHHLDSWRCTKSGNSWRLSLKEKFFVLLCVVWYSKQRPPYRSEIAKDLLVLTVLVVKERTEAWRRFYSSFGHFVYEFHWFKVQYFHADEASLSNKSE